MMVRLMTAALMIRLHRRGATPPELRGQAAVADTASRLRPGSTVGLT